MSQGLLCCVGSLEDRHGMTTLPDREGKWPEDGPGSGLLFPRLLGVQPNTFGVFTVSLIYLHILSLLHLFIPLFHSVSSDRSSSPRCLSSF